MLATRRATVLALLFTRFSESGQIPQAQDRAPKPERETNEDARLPNGKSQKDAISKQAHQDALKEIDSLIHLAEELRDELKRSGEFVIAVSSLKKTEEIEKLVKRIRGKLKA